MKGPGYARQAESMEWLALGQELPSDDLGSKLWFYTHVKNKQYFFSPLLLNLYAMFLLFGFWFLITLFVPGKLEPVFNILIFQTS